MRRLQSTAVVLVLLSLFINVPAQGQSQSNSDQSGISIGTTEINLDVVVRDKRGRIVRDLTAADFQIQEDSVPQDISSFRLVSSENQPGAAPTGAPAAAGPAPRGAEQPAILPNLVAIVFDRMSLDARSRAKDASLKFLSDGLNTSDFVGVFVTDLSLNAIQPFTRDRALVKKGIEAALAASTATGAASTKEQVRSLSDRLSALNSGGPAANPTGGQGAGGQGAAGADIGLAAAERMQLEMTVRSLETFEDLERTEQGHATTSGLSAIVSALGQVSGRKAVIFFSEGVQLPPDVIPHFRSVISNANRANVSFYTVDAAGLRAVSTTSETAKELASQANRRMEEVASGSDAIAGGALSTAAERNEDLIRGDPNSGLGQLARETGGAYVSGTNDPGSRLKVVDEDLRTHYVLTYVPKNSNFDGQFRNVSVTVKRADTRVQTREGYYAVASIGSFAVLPYEAKPLALLGSGKSSQAIQLRVMGLSFPQKQGTGVVPVLVQAPMGAFTFTSDQTTKTFKADFTIVALVKDEAQQAVRKLSNHYVLNGPLDKLESAMAGNVLFYKETTLDAGKYTVEAIAYDAPSERIGTKKGAFTIAPKGTLQISSMVIVDHTEKLDPGDGGQDNALRLGEMQLYPNVGTPLSKAKTKQMSFYATVNANGAPPSKATIEILQKGQKLAELPVELPKPDAGGRIQFANSLPLEPFPPGAYELRLAVTDGTTSTASSTTFSVIP